MILSFVFLLIHIFNIGCIFYMIFKEKRSANSIIAWTLVFNLAPAIGFIIFILIGRKINQSKMYRIKKSDIEFYNRYKNEDIAKRNEEVENYNRDNFDMINSLESMGYSPYREGNDVELFTDGKEFFYDLISNLNQAEKSINIQFYIFRSDDLGSEILNILQEKAVEGVEVRFLFDAVGCRGLDRKKIREIERCGVKVGEFFPSVMKTLNINMNHRNHRKIVVIDSKTGYVGGFNVGDEYLGRDPKFGYWRDTHLRIKGPAVNDLNLRFLSDWKYAFKENIDLRKEIIEANQASEEIGDKAIQILSSGPNESDLHEIKLAYVKMIQKAKKYIYIQTPYLILDNSVSDSLKLAALGGADVRIMIPGKGDHPFVYWVNFSYAGELLRYGIKIYHYDKSAFLHAKTVVIDDSVASIGTANMDTRSFELNFEVNAFIYDEEVSKRQRDVFMRDVENSEEFTLKQYEDRSGWINLKEGISKLFSSLL